MEYSFSKEKCVLFCMLGFEIVIAKETKSIAGLLKALAEFSLNSVFQGNFPYFTVIAQAFDWTTGIAQLDAVCCSSYSFIHFPSFNLPKIFILFLIYFRVLHGNSFSTPQ